MNQESKIKSLLDALLRYFEDFNGEVPYFEPTGDGSRYVEAIHGDSHSILTFWELLFCQDINALSIAPRSRNRTLNKDALGALRRNVINDKSQAIIRRNYIPNFSSSRGLTVMEGQKKHKVEMSKITNAKKLSGSLADVIKGADVFVGVSAPGVLTQDMIKTMADKPIIFACANPTPEIDPALAKEAGAAVVGTGRSDYPNQVNNVLAFPGLFRGALDVHATKINEEMKIAAAKAIASLVSDEECNAEYVIPSPFDPRVAPAVAKFVAQAAIDTGVAQKTDITPEQVAEHTRQLVNRK